ncbi:MAG: cytochrome c3 family protein [Thermodesulfobacteriota bacterium]
MSDKNELKFAYVIVAACLAVGVICYGAISAKSPEEPVRVMFESTGENVLFEHTTHVQTYGFECTDCHHAVSQQVREKPDSCGQCHTPESEHQPAIGENGAFDHETHSQYYGLSCAECHHEIEDGYASDPQPCSSCHMETSDDPSMPSAADAYHQQCIDCHSNMGGPVTEDCDACHKPRKRTEAFHTQCIDCHEDMGVGPNNENCKGCHGY